MAFKRKFRAKRRAVVRRKSSVRRSYASHRKGTFAKKVLKVVHRAEQKKMATYSSAFQTAPTAGACYQLDVSLNNGFLSINQGTGQADRIGNKIKIHKATLKYIMYPNGPGVTNVSPVPQDIRCVLAHTKKAPQSPPALATFFNAGDSSTTFTGNLLDMMQPMNTDLNVVYKDWRHKCGPQIVATASGGSLTNYYGANNDYKLNVMKTVDITKMVPSHFEYNDTSTSNVRGLYWNVMSADADGTPPTATFATNVYYTITYTFTDF